MFLGLPQGLSSKESTCKARDIGDMRLIPGLGRSPGEVNGNPLQYPYLENPIDRGAWRTPVHGLQSQTQLNDYHYFRYVFKLIQR